MARYLQPCDGIVSGSISSSFRNREKEDRMKMTKERIINVGAIVLVFGDVEDFGANEEKHVIDTESYEDLIACFVARFVFVTIDLDCR